MIWIAAAVPTEMVKALLCFETTDVAVAVN
jgi:hypothetical protein